MFLCDTIDIMPVKYNPGVKEFLTFIQPSLLSLRELSAASVDKHKCVIKICETGKLKVVDKKCTNRDDNKNNVHFHIFLIAVKRNRGFTVVFPVADDRNLP